VFPHGNVEKIVGWALSYHLQSTDDDVKMTDVGESGEIPKCAKGLEGRKAKGTVCISSKALEEAVETLGYSKPPKTVSV